MKRFQKQIIIDDLARKMVFLVGPRQVGKTWLARDISSQFPGSVYLNYDHFQDRQIIQNESWLTKTPLIIFDEIHKMPDWKNYLKGIYDTRPENLFILVTGSARLNTFRKGGDSLAGRFFLHRLMPFSPAELSHVNEPFEMDRLIQRGGFPEPFLSTSDDLARRWRLHYCDSLIRNDILDFERVHDFRAIRLTFDLLKSKVGSPVSYSSIARDVGVAPNTVKKYIRIFEDLFIVFSIHPYSKNIARSILKEPKIYFFDTGLIPESGGARYENFIALCLFKHALSKTDQTGHLCELKYLRTKDGREVDFCLTVDQQPVNIFEAKTSDASLSRNLCYFSEKYGIPGHQIVKALRLERQEGIVSVRRASSFLKELYL